MAFPPQGTAGNDTRYINGSFTTLHDGYAYLDGSDGWDAIVLTGGGTVLDFAWGGVSNFEALILASGSWNFVLGGYAAQAFTGKHVAIDALGASSVTVDGTALSLDATLQVLGSAGADSIIGGSGTNVFQGRGGADTLVGGIGTDFFYFDNLAQLRQAQVDGGGGVNNVILWQNAAVQDSDFASLHHVDYLYLDGSGAQSATLGSQAMSATDGQLVLFARNASSLNYDGSQYGGTSFIHGTASADTILGGAATDNFFGSGGADVLEGNEGRDYFHFASRNAMTAATGDGGSGVDTLVFQAQVRLDDVDFLNLAHMEVLRLQGGGAQIVTLGATASAAFDGAVSVFAATANGLYLDASAFTRSLHVNATAGEDSFIFGADGGDAVIYGFTAHGNANADQVQLLGSSLGEVQAMLAAAVNASNGTYLQHDGHWLVFAGVQKAALSTADFIIA